MELKSIIAGQSKGQLMTLIMLILLLLLLAELFAFALLNVSSNNLAQSLAVSSASTNYANLFKLSANNFAAASLSRAISTLATYESTPSYRKSNFITNSSLYLSYLVTNGMLPNDTSGYPQNAMGNLTLKQYNLSVANVIGFAAQSVAVNESRPVIYQTDPYHIRISYMERIGVNSSGDNYQYTIPVNASLSLNNTPDLFAAQRGVLSPVAFANIANLSTRMGGAYATSSNTAGYAYGTVYWLASNAVSGASCGSIPSQISTQPIESNTILATYNAIGLESCENSYAGLISYIAPSTLPAGPYLVYPASSNVLALMPSGTRVLLYGPANATFNIENLRGAASNGYFFASPFAPSYLDRAQASFNAQSPSGIFTFSGFGTQAGGFTSASNQYVQVSDSGLPTGSSARSMFAWIRTSNTGEEVISSYGTVSNSEVSALLLDLSPNQIEWEIQGTYCYITATVTDNSWHLVGFAYSGGALVSGTNNNLVIYDDGVGGVATCSAGATPNTVLSGTAFIGVYQTSSGAPFGGQIGDVQIYNTQLASPQVQKLYQEGISGVPISGNVVGWWPLNGNANDYSGNSNNGILVNGVSFVLLPGYARDSVFQTTVPTSLSPIPGLLSCVSVTSCASNTVPELYAGYMPLEVQSGRMQTANFNGQNTHINDGTNSILQPSTAVTVNLWAERIGTSQSSPSLLDSGVDSCGTCGGYGLFFAGSATAPSFGVGNAISATDIASANGIAIGWHMVTGVYDGSNVIIYTDGVSSGVVTHTGSITYSSTCNGGSGYCQVTVGDTSIHNGKFSGNITNVQIYSAGLSALQIKRLYQQGIAGLPIVGNLIGWWPLNGNAKDYSGYNDNGTASNVIYPYFSGTYNAPGLSTIAATSNEWQSLGFQTPQ